MKNIRVKELINTVELSLELALRYIQLLKEEDPHKIFTCDSITYNSLYWQVGHLAWAENLLLLKGTGGKFIKDSWIETFKLGEAHKILDSLSFNDLKSHSKTIHQKTILHLNTLKDSDLEKSNKLNFGLNHEPTIGFIINHYIRHLGIHTGQISWLVKMYGLQAV